MSGRRRAGRSFGEVLAAADFDGPGTGLLGARGLHYLRQGRVEGLTLTEDGAGATVRGSRPYRVAIAVERDELTWVCSCPMGDDGELCKHVVAVALAARAALPSTAPAATSRRKGGPKPAVVDLDAYVDSLDVDQLRTIVREQIGTDWQLRERLTSRAASAAGGGIDEHSWRRRIDAAFAAFDGYVGYEEAHGWARGVQQVLDALDELTTEGHAASVVLLAEHAHRGADGAVNDLDDSDGWLGEIAERIGDIHERACRAAHVDGVALAARLVELELTSELDTFHRAAHTYGDILGAAGLAEYRRLIEPRWHTADRGGDRWSSDRFRVHEAMIGVALASGDPDELLRVKSADLHSAGDYHEIAELLRDDDRSTEAVDWYRRGLTALRDRPWELARLTEHLTSLLRETGDDAGVLGAQRNLFEAAPSAETYRLLINEASRTGAAPAERKRAITFLRKQLTAGTRPGLAGVLVDVQLYEGDVTGAWTTASKHEIDERRWLTLARAREATHPLDAIPIYRRQALTAIDHKNNQGYATAVDLLARIRTLATAAGNPDLFTSLLADVRAKHKPKRNLMALLDKKRW